MLGGTHFILRGHASAELVVLVHGIGSYHAQWYLMAPALEEAGFRVLQYDLIGRGFSQPDTNDVSGNRPYSGESHLAQLRTLLTGLSLTDKPFHIVSHSMGGALSTLYVAAYPSEVKSLVLLSPAGLMDLGPVAVVRALPRCAQRFISNRLRGGHEQAWKDDFYKHGTHVETHVIAQLHLMHQHNSHAHDAFFESVLRFPLSGLQPQAAALAASKSTRCLLMWASHDKAVPFSPSFTRWQAILGAQSSRVQYEVFADAAHGFFMEKADEVAAKILIFLREPGDPTTLVIV